MKFGVQLPNLGPFSDADLLIELARQVEQAGWDGFFLWDHVAIPDRMADTMTILAAAAAVTSRIRLGPMITGPARRRPWKLAREATTLDHLSHGRFTLGVGLGASDYDFQHCHEDDGDLKIRAQRLDEALAIIDGLWAGERFSYQGAHFQVDDLQFAPRPVQRPRIPIWVAGWWPNRAPMRRAACWDGVFPLKHGEPLTPADWQAIQQYIGQHRQTDSPYEYVHSGITPNQGAEAAMVVEPYAQVGVSWWLEDISPVRIGWNLSDSWPEPWPTEKIIERIAYGPPRL
jgi:alkanesulfonate monooxygenase SsuD/methylene tetrahydromethanopterin reductase-like flavin-dependent oxidoreductase (luciferase family)